MDDKRRYEKVFRRFKKSELSDVAGELDIEIGTSTKREMVSVLVEKCLRKKVSSLKLLKIELKYISNQPNLATWKAYRLECISPSLYQSSASVNPDLFAKRLQLYLGDTWNYEMVQNLNSSGYWLCMRFSDGRCASYTSCILRCPPSPFLFLSGFRKPHLVPVLEAFSLAMDCVACTELGLSGKNLSSLVNMAHNQYSQGPLSAYRLNQVDPNPLLIARIGHSRGAESPPSKETTPSGAEQAKAVAMETFGTNPLPVLEKFTFNLKTEVSDGSDIICCRMKLVGSNVLEGTKSAISENCFSFPIPDIIKRIPTYASNSVTLDSFREPT